MKTVLLSPELFLAEGGIARIMRLYLKALCENCAPNDTVASIVLNDRRGPEPRLPLYSTPHLLINEGCERSKFAFTRATLAATEGAGRVVSAHLHLLPVAWLAQRFNPRLKYYLVAHGIDVWRPYSALETRALIDAERILCISDYTRRQMLRFCPMLDPTRLVIVPNTLDPQFVPPPAPPARPPGGPRVLTVGRLTTADTYKGFDTLIEAMPAFCARHPGATLRVVGGGDDLPRLRELVGQLGLGAVVTFTGIIDDASLRAEYAACDLFALPSRKEGFGLVFLEAMTYGKACLGARSGGVPEVINDEVGVLADYGNIPEIAAALSDLVTHPCDPDACRRHADSFAFPAFKRRLAAALA